MMQEQIFLDNLSIQSVSIRKQKFYTEEGNDPIPVGDPWRVATVNSERGRRDLEAHLSGDYYDAVMNVWGGNPVVVESTEPDGMIQ